jgi:hypothetical protein
VATLVASIATVRRSGLNRAWLVPLAFPILHISYGLGFLVGLVQHARWTSYAARQAGSSS